eukprot:TRINITY_DN807_c0_g1_i6.p1 TRINITY_DN807_c0_g1~~TRINITY_DN807_c0_g1_i6.p1  ORF type:complete len:892 (+),score=164.28 TRINITY_DN807_c0_g1_i6:134-2809(+)
MAAYSFLRLLLASAVTLAIGISPTVDEDVSQTCSALTVAARQRSSFAGSASGRRGTALLQRVGLETVSVAGGTARSGGAEGGSNEAAATTGRSGRASLRAASRARSLSHQYLAHNSLMHRFMKELAATMGPTNTELEKLIEGFIDKQSGPGDMCSARLLEAKHQMNALHTSVVDLATEISTTESNINTESMEQSKFELDEAEINSNCEKEKVKCEIQQQEDSKTYAKLKLEMEEMHQIANPSATISQGTTSEETGLIEKKKSKTNTSSGNTELSLLSLTHPSTMSDHTLSVGLTMNLVQNAKSMAESLNRCLATQPGLLSVDRQLDNIRPHRHHVVQDLRVLLKKSIQTENTEGIGGRDNASGGTANSASNAADSGEEGAGPDTHTHTQHTHTHAHKAHTHHTNTQTHKQTHHTHTQTHKHTNTHTNRIERTQTHTNTSTHKHRQKHTDAESGDEDNDPETTAPTAAESGDEVKTECLDMCNKAIKPWETKCKWKSKCDGCQECQGLKKQAGPLECNDLCSTYTAQWEEKCKWKKQCGACSECKFCFNQDAVNLTINGKRKKIELTRKLAPGEVQVVQCADVNPSTTGTVFLTCKGEGVVDVSVDGCVSPPATSTSNCSDLLINVQLAYAKAYVELSRLVTSYETAANSTACFDGVEEECTMHRTQLEKRMEFSSVTISEEIEKLTSLRTKLSMSTRAQEMLTKHVAEVDESCANMGDTVSSLDKVRDAIRIMGLCPGLSRAAFVVPTWTGVWAHGAFDATQHTDQEIDALMDSICAASGNFEGHTPRAAEISEIAQKTIEGLPLNNTASVSVIGACPGCAGKADSEGSPSHKSGHARRCWLPEAPFSVAALEDECGPMKKAIVCVVDRSLRNGGDSADTDEPSGAPSDAE